MSLCDPIIIIECDKCGAKSEYDLQCMAGRNLWSDAGAKEYFQDQGWLFKDDGDTLCQDCEKSEDEAENV